MTRQYVPTYTGTLTEEQMLSLTLALDASLKAYAAQGFDTATAPANSHIGTLRDLLENFRAIRIGNRRGGKTEFDIVMKKAG
jgi:hypothetical protein